MSIASLLEQVVAADGGQAAACEPAAGDVIADRFGCAALDERQRRACSLYLSLLGSTEQLAADCPCKQ